MEKKRDTSTVHFIQKNEKLLEHALLLEREQSQEETATGVVILPQILTPEEELMEQIEEASAELNQMAEEATEDIKTAFLSD